jgi:hypothetical protein
MSYIGRGIDQIDNISTLDNLSFNGSLQTFNLTQNSVAFVPVSADALQIQIDGVIQSGNYTVSGSTVTFDFTPSGSSVCNGIRHYGVGIITQPSDGSVNMAQLGASGTKSSSTFLAGDNTFKTVSGTTINTNADNRIITGSGTANTLNGEANLTHDGTTTTIKATAGAATTETAVITTANNANPAYANLVFKSGGNTSGAWIKGVQASGGNDGRLEFHTNNSGTVGEAMRVMFNGKVQIGMQSYGSNPSASNFGMELHNTNFGAASFGSGTGTNNHFTFGNPNGVCGGIATSGSNTSFNTSSDYRLKENQVAISDGITRLKTLKPYRFNFKTDADKTVDGFFAHEVTPVVPEAISGDKDAMAKVYYEIDDEIPDNKKVGDFKEYSTTEIQPQAIDQAKLVPLLSSAFQEAITFIVCLVGRVQSLEYAYWVCDFYFL